MGNGTYDLVVIGAGPAGEVGAIRAAQLGLKVALVEKNKELGGTCLNVGCIPTKALLESAKIWDKLQHLTELGFSSEGTSFRWPEIMARKEGIVNAQRKGLKFLMKKNKVDVYTGTGSFLDQNRIAVRNAEGALEAELQTKFVLLATGSAVKELPFAKANGKAIHNSDTILSIDHVPKAMAVIGAGVVGMEFAALFNSFGTKVSVIEALPQALPHEDEESVTELVRCFKKKGISIETNKKLEKVEDKGNSCVVHVQGEEARTVDVVLVAIGRRPVTDKLDLAKAKLQADAAGFIKVNAHYQTGVPHIYAVGDIIGTPALAHTASAEAKHAVEVMAGHHPLPIDYECNPSAVYTFPEIASIGATEAKLKERKIDYKVAKFPFAPMAKAKIEGSTEGFVKILYGAKYRELLGVHIVGAKATELIAEFVLGKLLETTVDEIGRAIHPHPTISETVMEAAHVAEGGAIHM